MKILVADDHAIFRTGLQLTLGGPRGEAIVLAAQDLDSLFRLIDEHDDADIVVVDLHMPGMAGHAGLVRLRERLRRTPILVLSASNDQDDVYGSLSSGASGYVHKGAPAETLHEAIRTVCAGGVFLPRTLLGTEPGTTAEEGEFALSPRQHQVLGLLARGLSNKRIAYDLGTTEGTVKAHVAAVMRRLGVGNRVQLIRAAERVGLLPSLSSKGRI